MTTTDEALRAAQKALLFAKTELVEAADKFWVAHCNTSTTTRWEKENRDHYDQMCTRMTKASEVISADLALVTKALTEARTTKATETMVTTVLDTWHRMPIEYTMRETMEAALNAALSLVPAEGTDGWQDIASAPKDGRIIWAHLLDTGIKAVLWNGETSEWVEEADSTEEWSPLWWMPYDAIPDPPAVRPKDAAGGIPTPERGESNDGLSGPSEGVRTEPSAPRSGTAGPSGGTEDA